MKTKREQVLENSGEKGNALIYVLIAIVLFAALSFILSKRTDNNSTSTIDSSKTELYADQIIAFASQAKTVIDQMMFTGTTIDTLDFTLPSQAGFETAPNVHKVFHPAGGGLSMANIPAEIQNEVSANPPAGWYIGAFNNVEWTKGTGTDVILTAYQISKGVCESLNKKITGNTAIPAISGTLKDFLIETAGNTDFEISDCAACEGYASLCVSNSPPTIYSYYNIVAAR